MNRSYKEKERMEKVSIVITTYNGDKYLEQTIQSALNQQDVDIDVVVVDDCSDDDSYKIADEFSKMNNNLLALRNEKNVGFCKSVNRGVNASKGAYVLILDQDDLLSEDHCFKMLHFFQKEKVVGVFCDHYLIDSNDNIFCSEKLSIQRDVNIHDLAKDNKIPLTGLLIRKSIFQQVGGFPESDVFPNYGEYHTWIRMSENGYFAFCSNTKSYYRRHDGNMTNSFKERKTRIRVEKFFWYCKKQLLLSSSISFLEKSQIIFTSIKRIGCAYLNF